MNESLVTNILIIILLQNVNKMFEIPSQNNYNN